MILMKRFWKAVAVMAVISACMVLSAAAKQEALVSPALSILADQCTVAVSESGTREIVFSSDDFERALNVSRVSCVTVTALPSRADGILYLGESEVREGQVISRENLPYVKFVFMNEAVNSSSFCFSTDLGAYDIRCCVYALEYENSRPTVLVADTASLSVGTYRDVTIHGELDAYDPEGDDLVFEIIEYPQNGFLTMTDSSTGSYRYMPSAGYVGKDSFRYVAVDRYGNYSQSAKVNLDVVQQSNALVYDDLTESAAHVAAISLTESGVMSSTNLDGKYYFEPEKEVSRAEFLVMAMKILGINAPASAETTVFADDAEISSEHRGYVYVAEKLGYVCGRIDGTGALVFAPNDSITRAEAAMIIYNMTQPEIPVIKPLFVDETSVPAWAQDAVYALTASGVITHSGGYVSADAAVTREQCAVMLYRLKNVEK